MGKQLTWAELHAYSVAGKRDWLLKACPKKYHVAIHEIIDGSGLDRSDLMLPTLYFYILLARELDRTASKQDITELGEKAIQAEKETLTRVVAQLQDSAFSAPAPATKVTWKEYARSPQGVVAAVIVVLLLLNLIF